MATFVKIYVYEGQGPQEILSAWVWDVGVLWDIGVSLRDVDIRVLLKIQCLQTLFIICVNNRLITGY